MKKLNLILCLIGVLSMNYSQEIRKDFPVKFTHCYYTDMSDTPGNLLKLEGLVFNGINENLKSWKKNRLVIDYAPASELSASNIRDVQYEVVDIIEDSLKVTFYCLGGRGDIPLKMTYIKKEKCYVQSFTRDGREWEYVWFFDLDDPLNSVIPENAIKTARADI